MYEIMGWYTVGTAVTELDLGIQRQVRAATTPLPGKNVHNDRIVSCLVFDAQESKILCIVPAVRCKEPAPKRTYHRTSEKAKADVQVVSKLVRKISSCRIAPFRRNFSHRNAHLSCLCFSAFSVLDDEVQLGAALLAHES